MNNLDIHYIYTHLIESFLSWCAYSFRCACMGKASINEWIKVDTSVVVRRVNAIHCGLPASLCVYTSLVRTPSYIYIYIYPSVSVRVGKYIRFIGERDRAARKGHTLPTLQWYLKPLFPKGSFAFCCCAFRYRSILFPFFLSSFFFFLLLASHTRVSRRIHKNFYSEINV